MQAVIEDKPLPQDYGIIHPGEGVDLLPANIELSSLEVSLFNTMSREYVLRSTLEDVKKNYDYILIDCMPSLGMLRTGGARVKLSLLRLSHRRDFFGRLRPSPGEMPEVQSEHGRQPCLLPSSARIRQIQAIPSVAGASEAHN